MYWCMRSWLHDLHISLSLEYFGNSPNNSPKLSKYFWHIASLYNVKRFLLTTIIMIIIIVINHCNKLAADKWIKILQIYLFQHAGMIQLWVKISYSWWLKSCFNCPHSFAEKTFWGFSVACDIMFRSMNRLFWMRWICLSTEFHLVTFAVSSLLLLLFWIPLQTSPGCTKFSLIRYQYSISQKIHLKIEVLKLDRGWLLKLTD